jgi:hypothetical protein
MEATVTTSARRALGHLIIAAVGTLGLTAPRSALAFHRRFDAAFCQTHVDPHFYADAFLSYGDWEAAPNGQWSQVICPVPTDSMMELSSVATLHIHGHVYDSNRSVSASAGVEFFGVDGVAYGLGTVTTGTGDYMLIPPVGTVWQGHDADFPFIILSFHSGAACNPSYTCSTLRGYFLADSAF